ncbi:hypothetical protein [Haloferax gibbonsii]|uniref:Uncharacterized protein n=1 Tax=Haloferax gibbonsii TaxID=35746 RepID=A0A0K1ISS7_HALGI|nr:hypothetical protein [Haloferax gibbonsii]AKU07358.1 hypothetical protein ABY42_06240 [Haloferax gibbonsii]QOS11447.1 uncharacterized protein HfgLR_06520 [Haloferax gibbonsii]
MEKQPRDVRRDGALVLLGLAGLVALQVLVPRDSVTGVAEMFRGGLFGGSVSVMAAGVFRVPDEQAFRLTAAVAVGFALGSLVFLL